MSLPKVIYVMGLPGAGKGTQAELLAHETGYKRFSTGDAFREISNQDTDLGRRVKETIDNGWLAPPEMAAEIVIETVKHHMARGEGLIFDGSPRTVAEAKLIDDFFDKQGYGKPLVIFLTVDKDEMINRNSKRRFCLDIKRQFPVMDEDDERECARMGGVVGQRPDDADPEKFETRWSEFMKHTQPVIENYKSQNMVHEVDGQQDIVAVHQSVMSVIRSFDSA